jgi:formylglycine-generating enzyme required for sulfatase activity
MPAWIGAAAMAVLLWNGPAYTQMKSPDFDGNGKVDFDDFFLFADVFGTRPGDTRFDAKFDLDSSGVVDLDDFFAFAMRFGETIQRPATLTVTLPGGATMEMVYINPGKFTMGSPSSEPGRYSQEGPQHEVTITKGFYLGKYEVTQGQWQAAIGTTPWVNQSFVQVNPDNPAVYVSWDDAQELIKKLNDAEPGAGYRLPTEAEWEYACRAGTTTRWSFGDDESRLRDYAWYYVNAGYMRQWYAHKVGTKLPNPWGLYDMHGNVWEWVQDWYGSYTSGPQTDPTGPAAGSSRVRRGGDYGDFAQLVRSAFRRGYPSGRFGYVGLRLLRQ